MGVMVVARIFYIFNYAKGVICTSDGFSISV